jgi:hypothetical protein
VVLHCRRVAGNQEIADGHKFVGLRQKLQTMCESLHIRVARELAAKVVQLDKVLNERVR